MGAIVNISGGGMTRIIVCHIMALGVSSLSLHVDSIVVCLAVRAIIK